eukprot:TRINITY_DN2664_c0_g1_i1.p1 TRINITY_DN2664_c0_g1~~TRINITY_DN2664_c0_g1_i1.p1  ORF type:complete len:153 (+),score=34.05 TRINITY_DN2664_c0_g1_i1:62-520(+)
MYGKGYGYGDWGGKGWGGPVGGYGWGGKGSFGPPWEGGKGFGGYGMMPPMLGFKGKGKGKGKDRSPQLRVDPSKKIWVGNIPESAKWKDLQTLVDQAGKSKWVEIFKGRGKGTAAVVYATAEEATEAISKLNGSDLCGSSIVVDTWEKTEKP